MAIKTLDITKDHCPMTFVKTKLALEALSQGDILEVLLTEGEPLENVPKSSREQGYEVLDITPIGGLIHKVRIKRTDV
ncbi:MAG: sulfurtransferase TusA family protein [Dethiobacter sp.]|jgi:TusA-related sulfurtransferase|nr:sulfurtransferase TusA family protein [Dethiobacter sp.]